MYKKLAFQPVQSLLVINYSEEYMPFKRIPSLQNVQYLFKVEIKKESSCFYL